MSVRQDDDTPPPDMRPFLGELRSLGNPRRAAAEKRYQKSLRVHYGVTFGKIDRLIRRWSTDRSATQIRALAGALWASDVWDAMICAGRLLALPPVPPDAATWALICRFMADVDGWALADNLSRAAARCIAGDETRLDTLADWAAGEALWCRRAALVFTLPYARPGRDPSRMLGWMAAMATDERWFIQKAIGWWLRTLSRHDPDRVYAFLRAHWPDLRAVARKEALRKLPTEHRTAFVEAMSDNK